MEQQQQQQPENVILPPPPPQATTLNIIIPPPAVNIVAPPPNAIIPGIPLQSMSPLGPAPTQLPPLVHPPPPPPVAPPTSIGAPIQSVINPNVGIPEPQVEATVPVQAQFETLNLNSPTTPPPPIPNELGTSQELVDGNQMVPIPTDPDAIVSPNGELAAAAASPEEAKAGTY